MPNISTSRDPGNCGVCFLVCNANEVNTALRQKKPDKNKKNNKQNKQNKEKIKHKENKRRKKLNNTKRKC